MAAQQEDRVSLDTDTDTHTGTHPLPDPNPPAFTSSATASGTPDDAPGSSQPTTFGIGAATLSTDDPGIAEDTVHGQSSASGLSQYAPITSPPASETPFVPEEDFGSGASPSASVSSSATPIAIRPASGQVPAPDQAGAPGPSRPASDQAPPSSSQDPSAVPEAAATSPCQFCERDYARSMSYNPERPGIPIITVEELEEAQLSGDKTFVQQPLDWVPTRRWGLCPPMEHHAELDRLARLESGLAAWDQKVVEVEDMDPEDRDEKDMEQRDTDERVTDPTDLEIGQSETLIVEDSATLGIDESDSPEAEEPEALDSDKPAAHEPETTGGYVKYIFSQFQDGKYDDYSRISDLEEDRCSILEDLERCRSHYETASELLDFDVENLGVEEIRERLEMAREWLGDNFAHYEVARRLLDVEMEDLGIKGIGEWLRKARGLLGGGFELELVMGMAAETLFGYKRRMEWLESMRVADEGGEEGRERASRLFEELRAHVEGLSRRLGEHDSEFSMYRHVKQDVDVHEYCVMADEYEKLKDRLEQVLVEKDDLAAEKVGLREAWKRVEKEKGEEREKWKNEVADVQRDLEASRKHVFEQVCLIGDLDKKVQKLMDENKTLKDQVCEKEYLELKERHQTGGEKRELWEHLQRDNFLLKDEVRQTRQLNEDKEMLQAKNVALEPELERLERRNGELLVQASDAEQERGKLKEELDKARAHGARKMAEVTTAEQRNTELADRNDKLVTEILELKGMLLPGQLAALGCTRPWTALFAHGDTKLRRVWMELETKYQGEPWPESETLTVSHGRNRDIWGSGPQEENDEGNPAAREDTPQSPAWEDDPLAGEDIYNASPPAKKNRAV